MNDYNRDKWEQLKNNVEVTLQMTEGILPLNSSQIETFESQSKILLPLGYKEFCMVFGEGCFSAPNTCINCPSTDINQINSNIEILDAYRSQIELFSNHENNLKDFSEILRLLDSSYYFGDTDGRALLIFDLRTYSNTDLSYDVYALDDDGNYFLLGRNFFEMIQDLCLGTKIYDGFPSLFPLNYTDYYQNKKTFIPTYSTS